MRTTIDLPDELFRKVKLRAVRDGIPLKELLRHYVELGLVSAPPTPTATPRRTRTELPVIRIASDKMLPDFINAQLNRLMDDDDLERAAVRTPTSDPPCDREPQL